MYLVLCVGVPLGNPIPGPRLRAAALSKAARRLRARHDRSVQVCSSSRRRSRTASAESRWPGSSSAHTHAVSCWPRRAHTRARMRGHTHTDTQTHARTHARTHAPALQPFSSCRSTACPCCSCAAGLSRCLLESLRWQHRLAASPLSSTCRRRVFSRRGVLTLPAHVGQGKLAKWRAAAAPLRAAVDLGRHLGRHR